MTDLVLKHGKIPIGWDEVLENTDKIPLPQNLIVQSWRGIEGGERASALNHDVIMSPQNTCYLNLKNKDSCEEPGRLGTTTIEKAYSYTPVTEKMSEKALSHVLGGECTLWTEGIPHSKVAEYLLFPRFCAISECLWLPQDKKDFARFQSDAQTHKIRLEKLDTLFYRG